MTDSEIRVMLADAMEAANVLAFRNLNLKPGFLAGEGSKRLDELDMDSLAVMELCIAIEINSGISIVPEELARAQTLDELVAMVAGAAP